MADQRPVKEQLFDLAIMAAALQKALDKKAQETANPTPPPPSGLVSTSTRRS